MYTYSSNFIWVKNDSSSLIKKYIVHPLLTLAVQVQESIFWRTSAVAVPF